MQILCAIDICWLSHEKVLKYIREFENELHVFLLFKHNKTTKTRQPQIFDLSYDEKQRIHSIQKHTSMISPSVKEAFLISEKRTVLENNSSYQDRILKTDVWQCPPDCAIASLKTL